MVHLGTTVPNIYICTSSNNNSNNLIPQQIHLCLPSLIIISINIYLLILIIRFIKDKLIPFGKYYDESDKCLIIISGLQLCQNLIDVLDGIIFGMFSQSLRLLWNFTVLCICLQLSGGRFWKIIAGILAFILFMVYLLYFINDLDIPTKWIILFLYFPILFIVVHQFITIRSILTNQKDMNIIYHLQTRQSFLLNLSAGGLASSISICFSAQIHDIIGSLVTALVGCALYPFCVLYIYNNRNMQQTDTTQQNRGTRLIQMEDYVGLS